MNSKRTVWIILTLTSILTVVFVLTGYENMASAFAGAFIGFASNLLGVK